MIKKTVPRLFCLIVLFSSLVFASDAKIGDGGKLQQLPLGKGWINLETDIRIPLKGWGKFLNFSQCKPTQAHEGEGIAFFGTMKDANAEFDVAEKTREVDGKVELDIQVTARKDSDIEGVFLWLDLPAQVYAGGSYSLGAKNIEFPKTLPENFRLGDSKGDKLVVGDVTKKQFIDIGFSREVTAALQDGRKWSQIFTVMIYLHHGKLAAKESASLKVTFSARGEIDEKPASLTLDEKVVRYKLAGIGGNYCFNIESPVTRYTLDNLTVNCARTEMSLQLWEPQNDDTDPNKINWPTLVANDKPGSRLHGELEIMQELSKKKIPYISSVWRLPAWLFTEAEKEGGNKVAPEKWAELLECITSYLRYAKEKYNAEPDYFSFNEPNYGVRVLFNPEEHRDAIKSIGVALAKAGLKTKMLIGDVAGPHNTIQYTTPSAQDADALKVSGAVSFHSWGGTSPQEYSSWGDLADKLKLPLIVAEAGPDSNAWNGGKFNTFEYGVQEVVHYQELLLHARPQWILLWEFTGDYSLLQYNWNTKKLSMTERFCYQKHWCDLVRAGSDALATSSDNDSVLLTAFRASVNGKPSYTLHVSNSRWDRSATITGIPSGIKTLNVVRTSRGEMFKKLETIGVTAGKITLDLKGQSLTTLTTLEIPELKLP